MKPGVFIDKIRDELSLYVSKRNILLGFGLIILFNIVLLPGFPELFSSPVNYPLDLNFAYSPATAYEQLGKIGKEVRLVYLFSELLIDLPYALVYSFVYSLLIVALFGDSRFPSAKYLVLVPLLLGVSDIFENLSIILMIILFSYKLSVLAIIGSVFTTLKWCLAILTFIVVVWGLIIKITGRK